MKRFFCLFLTVCLLCPICHGVETPAVSAEAAILMDADSGRILYAKDIHTRRLIASTTKLMTALVALESTPDWNTVIQVKAEYQAEGSSMYLRVGEKLTLKELLYGLLLASGNDAALAIAGGCAGSVETFVDWMNQRADSLGMKDTHFVNPNGLDDEDHYSTAYDMALLAQEVLKNEGLKGLVATRSAHVAGRTLTNHNKLLWRYEGCIGMKTGYTDAAGRTLVSCAKRGEQTLICVTLKDRDDWKDHAALFDHGFQNYPPHLLARKDKVFRTLPVTGSLLPQVDVVTASDVVYPLAEGERVRVKIMLPELVYAPVGANTIAGKLTFLIGEEQVGETYLLYAESVPENVVPKPPGLFHRMKEFLWGKGGTTSLAAMLMQYNSATARAAG